MGKQIKSTKMPKPRKPKTEAQKAARSRYLANWYQKNKHSPKRIAQVKVNQKKHRATQKFIETTATRNTKPETKAKSVESSQKFLNTEHGKVYRKDWRHNTAKGIADQKRTVAARKKKLKESPTLRIRKSLCDHLACRISGVPGSHSMQKTLGKYTDFVDSDIVSHFESQLKPGMAIHNYGSVWSIAHKIPKFWYGDSVENNHRLNTKANLGCDYEVEGHGEKTNGSKNIALPNDDEMLEQGKRCWPVEWMGILPSKEYRDAKIAELRKKQKRASSKATNGP